MDRNNSNKSERQKHDLILIHKIRHGDVNAFEKLVDVYIPQLTGFFRCLRVPESIIEDLIQETFEKFIKNIDSYEETKKFSSWIMTIGRNLYFDHCRKENRAKDGTLPTPDIVSTPEEEVLERQSASELLRCLKPQDKFLVEMRIFQGMQFAEISEVTGEKAATLRSRFFRILSKLKLTIKKDDHESSGTEAI